MIWTKEAFGGGGLSARFSSKPSERARKPRMSGVSEAAAVMVNPLFAIVPLAREGVLRTAMAYIKLMKEQHKFNITKRKFKISTK